MLIKKFSFLVISLISASLALAQASEREFETSGLAMLKLSNASGKVLVVMKDGAADKALLKWSERAGSRGKCDIIAERQNEALLIEFKGSGFLSSCRADIELELPRKGLKAEVEVGSGDLEIKDFIGELEFRTGSGDVRVAGNIQQMDGRTGSGSIRAEGLLGSAELRTGSGDVSLVYAKKDVRGQGQLKISTGSGNIDVFMPKERSVSIDIQTASGNISQELASKPDAPYQLKLRAGSGNISVKPLSR